METRCLFTDNSCPKWTGTTNVTAVATAPRRRAYIAPVGRVIRQREWGTVGRPFDGRKYDTPCSYWVRHDRRCDGLLDGIGQEKEVLIDEIASYSQVATSALALTAGTWTVVRRRRRREDSDVRPSTVLIVVKHDDDARVLLEAVLSTQRGDGHG